MKILGAMPGYEPIAFSRIDVNVRGILVGFFVPMNPVFDFDHVGFRLIFVLAGVLCNI